MFTKLSEGIALVIGVCLLMHVLFGMNVRSGADALSEKKEDVPNSAKSRARAAYLLFGSCLLAYGLAAVILRGHN